MMNGVPPKQTEVSPKAQRRSFTAEYKQRILREADACTQPGQIGALLRREGLYSSHLADWRREVKQRELAALSPKKRGPRAKELAQRDQQIAQLRRELEQTKARAQRAELLVEIQKKVSMLLGVSLDEPEGRR
jgi:transposase